MYQQGHCQPHRVGESEVGEVLVSVHGDEFGQDVHGLLALEDHGDRVAVQVKEGILVGCGHHAKLTELGLRSKVPWGELGQRCSFDVLLADDEELGAVVQLLPLLGWVVGKDLQPVLPTARYSDVKVHRVSNRAMHDERL